MAEKIEQTIEVLVEEGNRKGFLTYAEINTLLEDQFVPPERMDQIFLTLEDQGIDVVDDSDSEDTSALGRVPAAAASVSQGGRPTESAAAVLERVVTPERIDDPVRMYLTQMGEIPLLTREEEIFLAKSIEITRKRFRKKCMGSGLCMTASLRTFEEVQRGELAFDRTLKVNPNPKPDDDPRIVETLGKQFLALRLPVNVDTIRALLVRVRDRYRELVNSREGSAEERSEKLREVQILKRKLVILIEECHLQVKKVRPYMQMLEEHYREMRSIERKLTALRGTDNEATGELRERLGELEQMALEPAERLKRRIDQIRLHFE